MLKFAFAAGAVAEWVLGPRVNSALDFAHAAERAFMATILAWVALEAMRAVYRSVMAFDDKPTAPGH